MPLRRKSRGPSKSAICAGRVIEDPAESSIGRRNLRPLTEIGEPRLIVVPPFQSLPIGIYLAIQRREVRALCL